MTIFKIVKCLCYHKYLENCDLSEHKIEICMLFQVKVLENVSKFVINFEKHKAVAQINQHFIKINYQILSALT